MSEEEAKKISLNLRYMDNGIDKPGWYMFKAGECVRTPQGTGFVVWPLEPLGPAGWTYCHVQLDGHEDEKPFTGTCSVNNIWGQDVISIE